MEVTPSQSSQSSQLQPLDLPSLREASDLADVTFTFIDSGTRGITELKANKTFLACASDVFRTQFFGSISSEKVIHVEDSNGDAFDTFLDILYHVDIDLKQKNLKFLGEIFYLAEKYQVNDLKTVIVEVVENMNIGMKDVVEIMMIAEGTSQLEQFSESLILLCVKLVLSSSTETLAEMFDMFEVEESTSYLLHKLMSKVNKLKDKVSVVEPCKNCHQNPCINGEVITHTNFVEKACAFKKGYDKILETSRKSEFKQFFKCYTNEGEPPNEGVLEFIAWYPMYYKCC